MITGNYQEHKLYHDGIEIPLEPSLKLRNHSPTGFSFGYSGSGPAQTALALLLHFGATENEALAWHQNLKEELIAPLKDELGGPLEIFSMDDRRIIDWLEAKRLFVKEFGEEE